MTRLARVYKLKVGGPVAQWQSNRLITGRSLVRTQPGPPLPACAYCIYYSSAAVAVVVFSATDMPMTSWRLFRCLMLGTALVVAALAAACDGPRTDPAPSPAPTATAAPSPAPTTTPSLVPTPTTAPEPAPTATTAPSLAPIPATALRATPSPTGIEPTPAPTPRPSPEPTLQERIDTLFSQYRDNAPFNDHLNKLSDYQSPTHEALSSFETLAAYATQDFGLTKRAVIAAGFLGLDSSEANLTIDAYLKHQQKYDLQDPT